jgi:hypothetical protein
MTYTTDELVRAYKVAVVGALLDMVGPACDIPSNKHLDASIGAGVRKVVAMVRSEKPDSGRVGDEVVEAACDMYDTRLPAGWDISAANPVAMRAALEAALAAQGKGEAVDDYAQSQQGVMDAAAEWWRLADANGVPGSVKWLRNDETGNVVIYTRGEYADRLIAFIHSLAHPAPASSPAGVPDGDFPERKWFVVTGANRSETPILLFTSREIAEQYCARNPHPDGYRIYGATAPEGDGGAE